MTIKLYEFPPKGDQQLWEIGQIHELTPDGSNGYRYLPWQPRSEYLGEATRDVGEWKEGSDFLEGDQCFVPREDTTDAGTLTAYPEFVALRDHKARRSQHAL